MKDVGDVFVTGILITVCLAGIVGIVLGVDWVVWKIYEHFADKFGWYHLTFWEVVGAIFVLGVIGSQL